MLEITSFTNQFLEKLQLLFGSRLWFVGLQGSHGRMEATESSDIDMVVILDRLMPQDIYEYDQLLNDLPNRELICGFVSGKDELLNWEPSDLFQFFFDTKPILGSFDTLTSVFDGAAVNRAIRLGICNLYHGCVHNMLFDKSEECLRGLYKGASFVIQAIYYQQSGSYISRQKDLLNLVSASEQEILRVFLDLKQGGMVEFQRMSETLFRWCQYWINHL